PIRELELKHGVSSARWLIQGGVSVDRSSFDHRLVEEALRAGASFLPRTHAAVVPKLSPIQPHTVSTGFRDSQTADIRATIILIADGLNQSSLRGHSALRATSAPRSRLGLGTTIPGDRLDLPGGSIRMIVDHCGYRGRPRLPGGRITAAAGVGPTWLAELGPGGIVARIAGNAAEPPERRQAWEQADWKGTGPLPRQPGTVAVDDLL